MEDKDIIDLYFARNESALEETSKKYEAGLTHISKNILKDVHEAVSRTRNIAAPPNAVRLGLETPCASAGRCMDCLSAGCICGQIVVTRMSRIPGRIKVILVGEELGY